MVSLSARVVDVHEVINQLRRNNTRIERLLEMLPTSDDAVLSELDLLLNKQRQLLSLNTTPEKGTLFLEQASGRAMMLKERYQTLLNQGKLRKKR
ncbi:hypothetical protein JCM14469_39510 [Desulfatiferula olefinivorans]